MVVQTKQTANLVYGQLFDQFRGKLIVSCQALPGEPLYGHEFMAAMAMAAWQGGAAGIRANGPEDIRAIRKILAIPIIGLYKHGSEGVYITPTFAHACEVAEAGADIVAIDGTQRPRQDGLSLQETIRLIHEKLQKPVLADISTVKEGLQAVEAGADIISSTLSGYTPYSSQLEGPDVELVHTLAAVVNVPVLAEGRIRTPAEARLCLKAGAFAVVVGGAITRPRWITEQFVASIQTA